MRRFGLQGEFADSPNLICFEVNESVSSHSHLVQE